MAYGDLIKINGKQYKNITPNMTSDTEPAPYQVTCSSFYSAPEGSGHAFQAFADIPYPGANWGWISAGGSSGDWIKFDFGEEKKIDAMSFCGDGSSISFYGSNDDIKFDLLFSVSKTTDDINYKNFEMLTQYRYYRFNVNAWSVIFNLRFFI